MTLRFAVLGIPIAATAGVAMLAASTFAAEIPAAAKERAFFLLPEYHAYAPAEKARMEEFLTVVQAPGQASTKQFARPVKIAIMFPSQETSDAWGRLNIAIRKRLDETKVPYQVTEFMTRSGEHDRQHAQVEQVLAGTYDYVIIGPSEYKVQKSNLAALAEKMPTLVMNIVNPFVDVVGTKQEPLTHIGFDHSVGAEVLCRWTIKETGGKGKIALLRYIPGLIDSQRSDHFARCVEANSAIKVVDHYEANGDRELAFTGANALLSKHPDITMLHSGSTAVALGALAAAEERGMVDKVIINGWGGGADELASIKKKGLKVTAFRVNDDWGVSVAEAIRAHAEGRPVPKVVAATIKTIDYKMTPAEIDKETDYAFRYSGKLDR
ncbi:MAG: substrate-binding domain-containing protein [Rhodospirillales bacterium]|nr:substrate-binding domain-containing protein [Rhodospirillales bacterium]